MKVRCPECKTMLDLDINEYDEGDPYECPECNASLIVKVSHGKLKLKTEKEEMYDEMEDDEFTSDDFEEE